jgi:outer membrane phospholipase A
MATLFVRASSMFCGRLESFPWRLCAALVLAAPRLATAEDSTAPASGGATNVSSFATPFTRYLSTYEPIYFLLGTYPAAEFQFSLKYQVFAFTNHWARPSTNFYLAYTQTSFWDLLSSDPSFYDTSYKPSAFFYFPDLLDAGNKNPIRLDLQAGLEHESNGRGGTGERSLYTTYLQPSITFVQPCGLQLSLCPRAWAYVINLSKNNPDIASYRGYADLLGTLSWKSPHNPDQYYKLAATYGMGDDGGHSSLKLDLSVTVLPWIRFTPRIHVQYFTGYGQTLRQYNARSHGLRAGISLYD